MALNYPTKRKARVHVVSNANRGMDLEDMLNQANEYYLNNNKAVIYKKPTPVQIVKVDYPMRSKAVITEAYYKTPSTTDYNGIYRGKYIDFEAKENKHPTLFPLANVHEHQVLHLKRITEQGGIGFLIVSFNKYNEFYLMPYTNFIKYWNDSLNGGRKSIPYEAFKTDAYLIKESYLPRLAYLDIVDEIFF